MESQGFEGTGRFRRSLRYSEEETVRSESDDKDYTEALDTSSTEGTTVPPTLKRKPKEDDYCGFREWSVNVEQLGWDWLVFPERIPLNLCVGKCPVLLDRKFNATSHAVARGLQR